MSIPPSSECNNAARDIDASEQVSDDVDENKETVMKLDDDNGNKENSNIDEDLCTSESHENAAVTTYTVEDVRKDNK